MIFIIHDYYSKNKITCSLINKYLLRILQDSIENASSIASSRTSIPASIHVEDEKNYDSSSDEDDKPRRQWVFDNWSDFSTRELSPMDATIASLEYWWS